MLFSGRESRRYTCIWFFPAPAKKVTVDMVNGLEQRPTVSSEGGPAAPLFGCGRDERPHYASPLLSRRVQLIGSWLQVT
jgi:hypothetical protein